MEFKSDQEMAINSGCHFSSSFYQSKAYMGPAYSGRKRTEIKASQTRFMANLGRWNTGKNLIARHNSFLADFIL